MKRLKKAGALVLALLMTFVFAIPAMAAETPVTGNYSITINNDQTGHTYQAYQIFAGDVADDETEEGVGPTLSNITWGSGVNEDALLAALKTADSEKYGACTTAEDVAEALGVKGATAADAEAFAEIAAQYLTTATGSASTSTEGKYVISGLNAGYYLVKDATVPTTGSASDTIVQVLGNVTMDPKDSDIPTVEKKVQEDSKTSTETDFGNGYYEVADYEIGQTINFKLFGSIPDDISNYDTYTYTFHDTMSKGLTLHDGEYIAYLVTSPDQEVGIMLDKDNDYTFTAIENQEDGTTSITVDIKDLKSLKTAHPEAKYIMVRYEAELNENANIGTEVNDSEEGNGVAGNPNEVYLEFSNKSEGDGTGETPPECVVVFTYTLHGDKVDGESEVDETGAYSEKLEGAEFVLLNANGTQVAVIEKDSDSSTNNFSHWMSVEEAASMSEEEWHTFNETNNVIMTSNNYGAFSINGLDEGTYQLLEIKAPEGYNKPDDAFNIEITSHLNFDVNYENTPSAAFDTQNEEPVTIKIDGEAGRCESNGTVTATIANFKGSTLPETGGMGTTVFYVVGGVLVAGVLVLLVAKRRMGRAE